MHPLRQLSEAREGIGQRGLGARQLRARMQNDGNMPRVPMRSKMSA